MTILFRILSAFTSIYMILLFLRIFLTWFSTPSLGTASQTLAKITDPYLAWFRRFPQLRTDVMDFSPVAALAILALLNNVFLTISVYGRITIGILLSIVVSSLWSAVSFILSFFGIIIIVRLVAYILGSNNVHPIWRTIDVMTKPVLYRINRIIFRDRLVTFQVGLVTSAIVLLVIRIVGGIFIRLLTQALIRLPF
ncbi:MAG: YggT family protein [Termitinemataceae bacterium]